MAINKGPSLDLVKSPLMMNDASATVTAMQPNEGMEEFPVKVLLTSMQADPSSLACLTGREEQKKLYF